MMCPPCLLNNEQIKGTQGRMCLVLTLSRLRMLPQGHWFPRPTGRSRCPC